MIDLVTSKTGGGSSHNVVTWTHEVRGDVNFMVIGVFIHYFPYMNLQCRLDEELLTPLREDIYPDQVKSVLWVKWNPSLGVRTITITFEEIEYCVAGAVTLKNVKSIVSDAGNVGNSTTPFVDIPEQNARAIAIGGCKFRPIVTEGVGQRRLYLGSVSAGMSSIRGWGSGKWIGTQMSWLLSFQVFWAVSVITLRISKVLKGELIPKELEGELR